MNSRMAALLMSFALCMPQCVYAQAAARLALVIGNDNYRHVGVLRNARNDAQAVSNELTSAGFEVTLRQDLSYREALRAVNAFAERVRKGDEVAFFFAGHGVQVKRGNYLLPVDIEATSEIEVERTAIALDDVMDQLQRSNPRFALLIVDACRNNPLKSGPRSVGETRGLRPPEPPRGQMVVFSAGRGQTALDRLNDQDTHPNSVFTREFLKQVRNRGVGVESLMREVQESVERQTAAVGHEQRPALYNEIRGEFYFHAKVAAVVTAPASAVEIPASTGARKTPEAGTPLHSLPSGTPFRDCDVCPEMVMISSGRFMMGSSFFEQNRRNTEIPRHRVNIPKRFAMGKFEVTFAEWEACVRERGCTHNPLDNGWGRGRRPVINVSWEDAQQYTQWLSAHSGKTYRLPSEAEWEYAARAGSGTPFTTGETITPAQANFNTAQSYASVASGSVKGAPVVVGSFQPNAFGLHDVHGNVLEWTEDCANPNYQEAPEDGSAWLSGDCKQRMTRGGAWSNVARDVRLAARNEVAIGIRYNFLGFRVARSD